LAALFTELSVELIDELRVDADRATFSQQVLRRLLGWRYERPPSCGLSPTDQERLPGDSTDMVDAHCVATAVERGGGLFLTGDAADMTRLAASYSHVTVAAL